MRLRQQDACSIASMKAKVDESGITLYRLNMLGLAPALAVLVSAKVVFDSAE